MRPAVRTLGASTLPFVRAARGLSAKNGLTIVGWHRVDGTSNGLSTGIDDFRRHLDELQDWGAVVLPLDDAVASLEAGTLPPKAVALTFDDGYASVVETAWPLLRERGLATTLFAVAGYLAGDLRFAWDLHEPEHDRLRLARPDELRAAADEGLDIGSHTMTHPWLPRLSSADVRRELTDSRTVLEDLLGRPVSSLAYPTGGWTRQVRQIAAEAGYRIGITVDRGLNTERTPHLSLRRAFVPTEARDLRLILEGGYTLLRPLDSWRSRKGPSW